MSHETPLPKPKQRRQLFWPGFVIGFSLLALTSCGGLALMVGLNPATLAELQSAGPVWTPPPVPTPLPADMTAQTPLSPADASLPGSLQPGSPARNVASSRVNIRQTPGYLGKGDDDIVAQMEPGAIVTILEWPQAADQLTWWHIRLDASTGPLQGWVAESTASGVQILAGE